MNRTRQRPLPSGRVSLAEANVWGAATGVAGTALLYSMTNPVVAALGAGNILLYAGAYTYSKRVSELNTWLGAVVGAIPPVMGWAAATGGSLSAAEPVALATLLFLWQFPHFFALSYLHREDYARGNFQMVSVNDPTGSRTANLIMEYSLYLTAFPMACAAFDVTSFMFSVEGAAMNAYLLYLAQKFRQDRTNANARRVFLCSLWYLPAILAGFLIHSKMFDTKRIKEQLGEDDNEFSLVVFDAKKKLEGLCPHIMIGNSTPELCPKVAGDKAVVGVETFAVSATTAVLDKVQPAKKEDSSSLQ